LPGNADRRQPKETSCRIFRRFTPEDHPDVIAEEIRSLAAEVAQR
jgi:hypothetical protein